MSVDAAPGVRLVRAAVLAVVVVGLSLAAHLHGGGERPPVVGLLAGGLLLAALLVRLGHVALRPGVVVGLLAAGQLLVHLAMSLAAPVPTAAVPSPVAHVHHAGMTMPAPAPDALASTTSGGLAMLSAHLLAAVAVGVWLVAGEHAAWQLGRVVVAVVRRSLEGLTDLFDGPSGRLCPAGPRVPRPGRPGWLVLADAPTPMLGSASRRRGPPVGGRSAFPTVDPSARKPSSHDHPSRAERALRRP